MFASKKTTDNERYITNSVPLKALPVLKDLEEKKIFGFSLSGKGRVVKIDYGEKRFRGLHSLTPVNAYENWSLNYDYYHSIIAKAALWAARRESDVHITEMKNIGDLLTIKILNGSAKNKDIQMELVVRDRYNHIENRQKRHVKLSRGKQQISFRLPLLKGGTHFLDMWVKEGGKILNWKSTSVTITPKCDIEKLVLDKESYKPGDIVSGRIIFGQTPGNKLGLVIRLLDNFGRVMAEKTLESLDKKVDFSFKIKEPLSLLLKIEAELSDDKQVICDIKKEFPVVRRRIDDYFFAMWVESCDNHLGDLALKQCYAYGVDFNYCRPSAKNYHRVAKANLGIIPYFSGRFFPGYGNTRMDQDALVRTPCFTDPEFRLKLKKNLQRKAQLNKKYSSYYSLNINGGVSPLRCIAPLDLCFSPTCQKHFREYLKKEYQDLDA